MNLEDLKEKLLRFRDERDWAQFHSPRNLAMALSVEAGELLEHFLWLKDSESDELKHNLVKKAKIEEELADVFIYALLLADAMNFDLVDAAYKKNAVNAARYPAEQVRGSAKKHSEYTQEGKEP